MLLLAVTFAIIFLISISGPAIEYDDLRPAALAERIMQRLPSPPHLIQISRFQAHFLLQQPKIQPAVEEHRSNLVTEDSSTTAIARTYPVPQRRLLEHLRNRSPVRAQRFRIQVNSQPVTAPTASSTTTVIGGIFGGGKIVIGADGRIIAPLSTGISQVEEQPPDAEPDPIPDPDTATASDGYTSSLSRSSSSSSPASSSSAASCPMLTATSCGEDCYGPGDPADYAPDSDETESDKAINATGSFTKVTRGCDLPDNQAMVSTSTNGVSAHVSARTPHRHFASTSATGNGFDIVETHPVGKPLYDVTVHLLHIAEHIFNFQIMSRFWTTSLSDPRNKKLGGCGGNWLVKFYDPAPEAQAIANRIDSVPNLVTLEAWTTDWINAQKQFMPNKEFGMLPPWVTRVYKRVWFSYETRRGKITMPPMSIQFYEYMVSETQDYRRRGRNLGIDLAQKFSRKLDPNTPSQCTINIDAAMHLNYPPITAALVPPRPVLFPAGASGTLGFRQLDGPRGKEFEILRLHIRDPMEDGKEYVILPRDNQVPPCQGVRVMKSVTTTTPNSNPLFDIDCTSRKVTMSGQALNWCSVVEVDPANHKKVSFYCGLSKTKVEKCAQAEGPKQAVEFAGEAVWIPQPA
ncbi:hypothetical protein C8J57DRAFT_1228080 [Mycena rebaudengoi]|nr:hypothetical protein C8J57DRAFT_1228080 [Mycena rebaudengoi]